MPMRTCEEHGDAIVVWDSGRMHRAECPACEELKDVKADLETAAQKLDNALSEVDSRISEVEDLAQQVDDLKNG